MIRALIGVVVLVLVVLLVLILLGKLDGNGGRDNDGIGGGTPLPPSSAATSA